MESFDHRRRSTPRASSLPGAVVLSTFRREYVSPTSRGNQLARGPIEAKTNDLRSESRFAELSPFAPSQCVVDRRVLYYAARRSLVRQSLPASAYPRLTIVKGR